MRILWLSWRDLRNPVSGGAELADFEIARRWVRKGHQVTFATAMFPGAKPEEVVEGIRIVRKGGYWTVHFHGWRFYSRNESDFDFVIDELHGIPFLTPLYVKKPHLLFAHEVAREIWFYMYPLYVAIAGYLLEFLVFRLYRRSYGLADSESTKRDLIRLGMDPKRVNVFRLGISHTPVEKLSSKTPQPTILFVGRICAMKRVLHLVRALPIILSAFPQAELWLVGSSNPAYQAQLEREADRLNVRENVKHFGKVSKSKKIELMQRASVFASASVREGWGLAVIESNSMGTPAVVYDVPGFRDSVSDGVTGVIARRQTPSSLAEAIIRLCQDRRLYDKLRNGAWDYSKTFDWDETADAAMRTVENVAAGYE